MKKCAFILWIVLSAAAYADTPRINLNIGIHLLQAEIMNTQAGRMRGLMFRKELAPNEAMLFVFPEVERHCMWMKNTFVPLSVAFIDDAGRVVNIEDMTPQSEETHCAAGPARYALETNRGWYAKRGVKAGSMIGGIDKAPPPQ